MNTIKEKPFYEAQKYIATTEWKELKSKIDLEIDTLREFILEDSNLPQKIKYSRNQIRGL